MPNLAVKRARATPSATSRTHSRAHTRAHTRARARGARPLAPFNADRTTPVFVADEVEINRSFAHKLVRARLHARVNANSRPGRRRNELESTRIYTTFSLRSRLNYTRPKGCKRVSGCSKNIRYA